MSRVFVRRAVYSYLTNPGIAGVDVVFPAAPFDLAGVALDTLIPTGQTHTCYVVIDLGDSQDSGDHIFIFDGAGGRRIVPYPVALVVTFIDISGDPQAALDTRDTILDAIKARMMTDPSIGQSATTGLLVAATPKLNINPGVLERQGTGDTFASQSVVEFDVSMYEFQT